MANEVWQQEEQKFLQAIQGVRIPNSTLTDVPYIIPKSNSAFDQIPVSGGCYWIWTNEPVLHTLHKNKTPDPFEGGEIIYNGIAKDDVKGRALHHLLGDTDADWSGISLDIYFDETTSHRKKALADKGKVPYVKDTIIKKGTEMEILKPIRSKDDFLKINLSEKEKQFVAQREIGKIYFRNGINILEEKHSQFDFRVYFITGLSSLYLDFIEKKWRKDFGLPKLCSYLSGR